jgi:protein tyrosine/serine phosphatase
MHFFNRRLRTRVAAVILAAAIAGPALAADNTAAPSANPALARTQIENFGPISSTYFRGAQPEGRDYADLGALGIRTVIDLQADGSPAEQGLVEAAGMRFHRIPMTTHTAPTADQIATFLKLVTDPANQPVYVHCAGGRHRTGVMTAIYRMSGEGWTAEKAFQEMKQYKFGADFLHPEFKRFVYAYQPTRSVPAATAAAVTVRQ